MTIQTTQVSRTLLSFPADFITIEVWLVSILPLIFEFLKSFFQAFLGLFPAQLLSSYPSSSAAFVFFLLLWQGTCIQLFFRFFVFSLGNPLEWKNPLDGKLPFLLINTRYSLVLINYSFGRI